MVKILSTLLIASVLSFASELTVMQKACQRGIAEACHDLGILYNGAHGLKADAEKEKSYLMQGCDLDSDKACYDLENIDIQLKNDDDA